MARGSRRQPGIAGAITARAGAWTGILDATPPGNAERAASAETPGERAHICLGCEESLQAGVEPASLTASWDDALSRFVCALRAVDQPVLTPQALGN
jgi:hypothetical protein